MSNPPPRPDPDALLRRIHAEEQRARSAKLKIFFGFAPGVGKTYSMLESARRLVEEGVDVVVGFVETHGRYETAAILLGLEVLPRRTVVHRGVKLEEFDLERALARRPAILLVDELAHTNVAGMRHAKRHQDVTDLLDAGIDVHTTLNVQHLESLNDVVAQITSVRVRETVPDAVLDRADEIELVDLPPEELLVRLREGKVYLGDAAKHAADNFFRRGNLLALRELALRRTADRVDADVQAYREEHAIQKTWAAGERLLVCVSPSPSSARLVRATCRMAAGLRAPWVAASVGTIAAAPLSRADRDRLDGHLRLAESLGAEIVRLSGAKVSEALIEHARKHSVTRIILGKPTHPRLRDRLRGSLLDEVVRASGDIDVHVISGDDAESSDLRRPRRPRRASATSFAWAGLLVAAATTTGFLGRTLVAPADVVMVYLLVIMVTAVRFGRGPAFFASAMSVAAYDFFFVLPYYTFAVSDTRHVLTFAMMFGVGIMISQLTLRIRMQERHARQREARTASLYSLSRDLSSAVDEAQAAALLSRHVADMLHGEVCVLEADTGDAMRALPALGSLDLLPADLSVARWVLEHGRPAGRGTDTLPGARVTCFPLRSGASMMGVLALSLAQDRTLLGDEREVLETFARQGALAIERARLAREAQAAALRARTEELRSSLLSAVSHDLRTPLAAITGAATTLRDAPLCEADRAGLLQSICDEAERLERLVRNLLDMTRLESGGVTVKREWVPLDEMVGAALTRLEAKLGSRPVKTEIAADVELVSVDPVLLQQVFVNLLENALKYTPDSSPIDIRASNEAGTVVVEVADRGPGLPAGDEERVFDKFHRGAHNGIGGVGLGLPICRAILQAHGGTIRAEHRPGGGALFRIALPVVPGAPSIDLESSQELPEGI